MDKVWTGRVKWSAEGLRVFVTLKTPQSRQHADIRGTVICLASFGTLVRVLWDGYKTPHDYHPSFLEMVSE